jgi:hypothetical protein
LPTTQSCDPAAHGRNFNTTRLATVGVGIEVRWDWDGVSVWPNCDGPLVNGGGAAGNWAVRVKNPTAQTWYVHTTRKNGQPATYSIAPGQTQTLTVNQMASAGYTVFSDFSNLTLTTTP